MITKFFCIRKATVLAALLSLLSATPSVAADSNWVIITQASTGYHVACQVAATAVQIRHGSKRTTITAQDDTVLCDVTVEAPPGEKVAVWAESCYSVDDVIWCGTVDVIVQQPALWIPTAFGG